MWCGVFDCRMEKLGTKIITNAPAGNRTRGPTMATLDFTTKPLALNLFLQIADLHNQHTNIHIPSYTYHTSHKPTSNHNSHNQQHIYHHSVIIVILIFYTIHMHYYHTYQIKSYIHTHIHTHIYIHTYFIIHM